MFWFNLGMLFFRKSRAFARYQHHKLGYEVVVIMLLTTVKTFRDLPLKL